MPDTAIEPAKKPGWKTTEFWIAGVVVPLLGALFASGLISEGSTFDKALGLVVSLLSALGYTVARTKAKA